MKLITRNTDYAVRAIGCIASAKDDIVTVIDLSNKLNMPRSFSRKILQQLSSKGFLKSLKGIGGGFSLEVKPDNINIFDIMEIFQGAFQLSGHVFRDKTCPEIKTCRLKKKMDKIEKHVIRELKSITIASLLRG